MEEIKFLTDGMLDGLTKWLRLLGFDTECMKDIPEDRTTSSGDIRRYFLSTSRRHIEEWPGRKKILLKDESPTGQLHQLDEELNIFSQIDFLSRCRICNIALQTVSQEQVSERIPPQITEKISEFYECPSCKRVYWEGGHVQRMIHKLKKMVVPIKNKGDASNGKTQ